MTAHLIVRDRLAVGGECSGVVPLLSHDVEIES
jgi:hypothetical protein